MLGVGLDIVDVVGFRRQLEDPASGFAGATFTRAEQRACRYAHQLASRFAAKEAFIKAWSVARAGQPPALPRVDMRDIEVVTDPYGRPGLRLHRQVAAACRDLGEAVGIHLSLSHDGPTAAAVVILDAGASSLD